MHITDGVLSTPTLIATNLTAAGVVAGALSRVDYDRIPKVGVMAAVFFMASFIHVNAGPVSVHLLLNGFLGLLLGWAAIPAIAVALFLQWILLGYGGITALGANTLIMGLPAVAVGTAFRRLCAHARTPRAAVGWGALAGLSSVALTCCFFVLILHAADPKAFSAAIKLVILAHIPIALLEAVVAAAAVGFLRKARPDLLSVRVRGRKASLTVAGLILLLAPAQARAHQVKCFASVDGDRVVGYAWVGGGARLHTAPYRVLGPEGDVLATGTTGKDGSFSFKPVMDCDHEIIVDAGAAHTARFTVGADEIANVLPWEESHSASFSTEAPLPVSHAGKVPRRETAELRHLIAQAVSREIAPLRRELAEFKSRQSLADLTTGLGFIAGITGVSFFFLTKLRSRERKP